MKIQPTFVFHLSSIPLPFFFSPSLHSSGLLHLSSFHPSSSFLQLYFLFSHFISHLPSLFTPHFLFPSLLSIVTSGFFSFLFLPNVLSPFPFLAFSFFSHYLLFPLSLLFLSSLITCSSHYPFPIFPLTSLHPLFSLLTPPPPSHFLHSFLYLLTSSPRLSSLLNLPPFYLIYPLLSLLPLHSPLSIIRINTVFIFSPLYLLSLTTCTLNSLPSFLLLSGMILSNEKKNRKVL